jgi:hypothetical protein
MLQINEAACPLMASRKRRHHVDPLMSVKEKDARGAGAPRCGADQIAVQIFGLGIPIRNICTCIAQPRLRISHQLIKMLHQDVLGQDRQFVQRATELACMKLLIERRTRTGMRPQVLQPRSLVRSKLLR